ncbi:MAG: M48 family metallopeptidase, partial [Planctomycetota bacterium]
MDFFDRQDVARRKTGLLVVLFALATLSIIASVYLVVAGAMVYATKEVDFWHPELLVVATVATVAVIAGGSLYKIAVLRGGGSVVAASLGGKLIAQDTTDVTERKVLNVVEEMAIASGTPVPPVYMMQDEKGINAFAAGYTTNDAVIGVTRGCVEHLSRDELQGVIAHEFSHIFNGDMRLNIRLIGILNGILIIGMIGYFVMRTMFYTGGGRRRGKDGSATLAILAIGVGLMIVGFLGTLFGNMIKAAVSRQREFLADASAVQFTRDPGAVAGALKKIGSLGSSVGNPAAAEVSHMFFARAITSGVNSMFSTHPPLKSRILRIDPGWDGTFPEFDPRKPPAPSRQVKEKQAPRAGIDVGEIVTGAAILASATAGASAKSGETAAASGGVAQIGQPTPAHVEYAGQLLRGLPSPVAEAAREPYGARAVIYALLINREEDAR